MQLRDILTPEQIRVAVMFYVEDRTHAEIGQSLRKTRRAVGLQLQTIAARLARSGVAVPRRVKLHNGHARQLDSELIASI